MPPCLVEGEVEGIIQVRWAPVVRRWRWKKSWNQEGLTFSMNWAMIGGVSLQRSIMWISLERRTLDLFHLLHPDLEYRDIRSPRGSQPRPGYLQGAATREHGRLRPTRKGQPAAASLQGVAARGPAASRGGDANRRGGRPLVGRLPTAKGNRRLRKGCNGNGAVRVEG
ncbi:hypothetical protein B296_00004803 [Ensete ventricosum]|uniref:Uncharacterized protein n=1 Tax=Ensete ventricosum TaxID=4639 RepID=A0A426YJE2_ENSVE|nr:hypothetical protein B296_00004803 [Ensete ventricosum]